MSAPSCPQCSTVLKDDYGMVSCPKCGAIVFIDLDGAAHVSSPEGIAPNQAGNAQESAGGFDPGGSFGAESLEDNGPSSLEASFEASFEPAGPNETFEAENKSSLFDAGPEGPEPSQFDPKDPLGISAYANSEISGAIDGPLVVTLIVSGIDTKDNRDEIRQVLQDPRFGWDANSMMAGLKDGELRLDRITPVKAMIVVNRIKHLAVQISWEQSAITELDPQEPSQGSDIES